MTSYSQKKANRKYLAKQDTLVIHVPKDGTKDLISLYAMSHGYRSTTQFVLECIREKMEGADGL